MDSGFEKVTSMHKDFIIEVFLIEVRVGMMSR